MQDQHTKAIVTRLESVQTLPVREDIVFGLDVGIASCGWAVISTMQKKILGMGVHCFDPAEDPKTHVLKNATRREKRGQRRVIRRRAQRMNKVREVIREHGLLADPSHRFFHDLGKDAPDPWKSRVEGLDRSLTGEEAAAALIHIAKHRGFQSNSKSDKGQGAPEDTKKALSAMHETKNRLEKGGYRTFGELVLKAPKYPGLRRNREGDFSHTPMREWTKDEAKRIIKAQRDRGTQWATEKFEERYLDAAFHQLPLQSSENLVGDCPFEKPEKRTARYAYSFEKFRALQKLAWLEVIIPVPGDRPRHRHLTCAEIKKAVGNFGKQKSLDFKALKKLLELPAEAHFEQAPDEKKEEKDITGNTRGMCPGSYLLRKKLEEEDWNLLITMPEKLDRIAEILTFNESLDDICRKFESLDLSDSVRKKLNEAVEDGAFNTFKKAGHISAKAARNMIPHFFKENAEDRTYDKVCNAAGYDHTVEQDGLDRLRNPVVTQSIVKALRQVTILARHYQCRPCAIHVELLRDVGKSAEERDSIYKGNKERTNRKVKNREDLAECVKQDADNVSAQALEMYELSIEQQSRCAYCDSVILPTQLIGNDAQIDHIFPQSRFSDGSFVNKVLTCVSCNQKKSNRTPWEWYESGKFPGSWEAFEERVRVFRCKPEKKRRLLNTNFQKRLENDQQFANRHKVDSSYIARLVTAELRRLYPEDHEGGRVAKDRTRRILARPGPLTSVLRRAWLSKTMKEVFGTAEKTREDDRHHAVDALTVASCDEKALQRLTRAHQELEKRGRYKWTPNVEPPWESFAEQAKEALNGWLVCRTESRRARGPGHEETFRRRSSDGVTYDRKPVEKLTEEDLKWIPDQCNVKLMGPLRTYVQGMKQWREENKGKKEKSVRPALPRSPKGDEIRKVRLKTNKQTVRQINAKHMGGRPDRNYHGGLVENTNMFRVDVYHVKKKREDSRNRKITPGYYLVPVYGWQVMDKKRKTPVNAIVKEQLEDKWPEMNPADFLFALYKDSYVEIVKKNDDADKVIGGYYRSTDRTTGRVGVSLHNKRHKEDLRRIGVKTISSLRKFMVDRLGRKYEVKKEPWPGNKSDKCPGVVST